MGRIEVSRPGGVGGGLTAGQVAAGLGDPGSPIGTAGRVALVPFWAPGEALSAGAVRMTALGVTIRRNSAGTTRSTYDTTEAALWTVTGGAATGPTSWVLYWNAATTTYDPAALRTNTTAPREFRGPVDPATISGLDYQNWDAWTDSTPLDITEAAQDAAAAALVGGTHVNAAFAYDDVAGRLNLTVTLPEQVEVFAKPYSEDLTMVLQTVSSAPFLNYNTMGMTSGVGVYGPTIIDVRGKIANPINNYYLLLSTDHATDVGGLYLATGPHPTGPWTPYSGTDGARVYIDTVLGFSTETPDIAWDPIGQQGFVYYQQAGVGGNQGTCLAITKDFITYERIGPVITAVGGNLYPGDLHTGYAKVTRWSRGYWTAVSLNGGGSYSHRTVWYSFDGINWTPDPTPKFGGMEFTGRMDRTSSPSGNTLFRINGELWCIGVEKNYSSAVDTGGPVTVAGPIHPNLYRWKRQPQQVWFSQGTGFDALATGFGNPTIDDAGDLYFMSVVEGKSTGGIIMAKASFVPSEMVF